jgi:hypothetical protein
MSFGKRSQLKPVLRPITSIDADGAEKRRSTRRATVLPGLIYPGGAAPTIPCTISNQSITGVQLTMQPGWLNPFQASSCVGQTFTLLMRADRMAVDCEIMRLENNVMGVRFISVPMPIARKN